MTNTSVLEPVSREATVKGETLKVTPLKVGQIPAFTRAIRPVFAAFAGLFSSIPLGKQAGEGGETQEIEVDFQMLAGLIEEHGETMIKAVAIATRKDAKEIEDLELDEFVGLARAIIEVNADFFARAMAKATGK